MNLDPCPLAHSVPGLPGRVQPGPREGFTHLAHLVDSTHILFNVQHWVPHTRPPGGLWAEKNRLNKATTTVPLVASHSSRSMVARYSWVNETVHSRNPITLALTPLLCSSHSNTHHNKTSLAATGDWDERSKPVPPMDGRAVVERLPGNAQPVLDRGGEWWAKACSRQWWLFMAEACRSSAFDGSSARAWARTDDWWSKFYPRGGWRFDRWQLSGSTSARRLLPAQRIWPAVCTSYPHDTRESAAAMAVLEHAAVSGGSRSPVQCTDRRPTGMNEVENR
jgi:hypothetical protein